MNYPAYNHSAVVTSTAKSTSTKWIICVVVSMTSLLCIVVVGIGLGVGLGLGLRNKSNDFSSSVSYRLTIPTVNCTYVDSSVCGCAATKPTFVSTRIINGYTAAAHSWPWTVVLYYNNAQRCGGFLVTFQHVITAAHCVTGLTADSLQVYAGVHSLSSSTDRQIHTVSQIKIHPDYSTSTYLNDIAILKLSSNLLTSTAIGLCCLPSSSTSLPIVNEYAVIVGWGRTSVTNSFSTSDTLQQAIVQIQDSSSSCDTSSSSDRQFCAGYGTSDACQGDSGGPLMTSVNNAWTCTGIVSYGQGCGYGGYYTRVSYYRLFIDNTISTL
jgi:secreted trypsin-like serine protease